MARLGLVEVDRMDEGQRAQYDRFPSNLTRALLLADARLAKALPEVANAIRASSLDARLREAAILRVAALHRSAYERLQHLDQAKKLGWSDADIAAIEAGDPPAEVAGVLRFVDECVRTGRDVDPHRRQHARPTSTARKLGRPLSFDRDAALRRAMLIFWRYGYETTSITDLTGAMGISPPSLYATFGDKRRLFLETVRLYVGDPQTTSVAFDVAPTSREAARGLLTAAAAAYTGEDTPSGLLASATASGSAASADVQEVVAEVRRGVERRLSARIERDVAEGVLPAWADARALSGLVMAVMQGMSVLARDGAERSALLAIAAAALAAWPAHPPVSLTVPQRGIAHP